MTEQDDWERRIKDWMYDAGWECDRDTEDTLGFCYKEGEEKWYRDYDKKKHMFIHYNGNTLVNVRMEEDEIPDN
jgi:hypothetical protein